MKPHVEQFEAQERMRKMQMVDEYLRETRRPDDRLRVNFTDYVQGVCDESMRVKAMGSALSSLLARPRSAENG